MSIKKSWKAKCYSFRTWLESDTSLTKLHAYRFIVIFHENFVNAFKSKFIESNLHIANGTEKN
jgi:hypothetical protein